MENLNIALIQSHLLWENPEGNRTMFSEKITTIPNDIDLIILPEMFTTGFTMNPKHIPTEEKFKTVHWMQEWAQKKDAAIVGSIVNPEEDTFYNRLWFVSPKGLSTYDKRHTFTLAGEDRVYSRGEKKIKAFFRGFTFSPLICYDLRFPVWARNVENYDVLLYVANWPKPRISAWDTLLKARAIENMAYCIGVNRVGQDKLGYEYPGHSAVYDTLGNQLVFSEKEEVLYATLSKKHITGNREKLHFLEDRDPFNLL
ncbi:MAG: nitrilase family protein [Bacteroidota bacterium]